MTTPAPTPSKITIPECPIRKYHSQTVDKSKMSYMRCFEDCSACYYNR